MGSSGDYEEFLVAFLRALTYDFLSGHPLEGVLAEIAAVSPFSVDQKYR